MARAFRMLSISSAAVFPLLLLLLSAPLLPSVQLADAADNGTIGAAVTDDPAADLSSSEQTLLQISRLASWFLSAVISPGRLADLDETQDLSSFRAAVRSAEDDWSTWLRHYWSYVVCLVLAAVYVVGMPIVGCLICVCRSRGRRLGSCGCGARSGKAWLWQRRLCTALLLLLDVGLLFGVISMFLAATLVGERTRDADGGVPPTVAESLAAVDGYLSSAGLWYRSTVPSELAAELRLIADDELGGFSEDVRRRVADATNTTNLLTRLETIAGSLDDVAESVRGSAVDAEADSAIKRLDANLTVLKSRTEYLDSCDGSADDRQRVEHVLSSLSTVASFGNLTGLTELVGGLNGSRMADVARRAKGNLQRLQEVVENGSLAIRTSLIGEHDKIIERFSALMNDTASEVDGLSLAGVTELVNGTLAPLVDQYGRYFYYGGLALSSVVLLVDALYFLGLLYGGCGGGSEGAECCQRSRAEPVLKAGLAVEFAFSWLLMLAAAALLPIGGLWQNDFCANFVPSPTDRASAGVVDRLLADGVNLSWSVLDLYERCDRNETLYQVLVAMGRSSSSSNLTSALDPKRYDIEPNLNRLKSESYQQQGRWVVIDELGAANVSELNDVAKSWPLDGYDTQLRKTLLSEDLAALADGLETVSCAANLVADLRAIDRGSYEEARLAVAELNRTIDQMESLRSELNETIKRLGRSAWTIDAEQINETVSEVVERLSARYRDRLDRVKHLVGRSCGFIGRRIGEARDGLCERLFRPYKAFWLSAAWCLALFVAFVPTVLALIDAYWSGGRGAGAGHRRTSYDKSPLDYYLDDVNDGRQVSPPAAAAAAETRERRTKGSIPYEHLPAVSGARTSPVTGLRDYRPPYPRPQHQEMPQSRQYYPERYHRQEQPALADDWDWQPDDKYADDHKSYERQWTNLAFEDSYDRRPAKESAPDWRLEARQPGRNPNYHGYNDDGRPRRYDDNPPW